MLASAFRHLSSQSGTAVKKCRTASFYSGTGSVPASIVFLSLDAGQSGIPVVSIAVVSNAVVSIAVVIITVPVVSIAVVSIGIVSIAEPHHVKRLQCSNLQLSCGSSLACHAALVRHSGSQHCSSQHCGTGSHHCGSQHCRAASCHAVPVLGRVEAKIFCFRIYAKISRKVLISVLRKKAYKNFLFSQKFSRKCSIRIADPDSGTN
jgi:hypothetical protein